MDNNINDQCSVSCSGCGVCEKVCPTKAIEIKRQQDGFYSPSVNEKCIECGMCKKVCFKFLDEVSGENISDAKGYLAYSLDQVTRFKASSGGIGKELSKYAIDNGYEICGVEYDYKNNLAKHVILDSIEEIDRIVGSKYIPSYTVDAFEKLDKNKKYLIVGTPCQIYGLRKLKELRKINNVILVDFFCHGTPSLNLWDKYLDMIKRNKGMETINSINFRNKENGWHNFSIEIKDSIGKRYNKNLDEDLFMNFFLENVNLDEPCYDCKLRFDKIYSDIRMGDFWGAKCSNDEKGTSIILANTELGEKVFKSLNNIYSETITFEELKQSQYVQHLKVPQERYEIQEALKSNMKLEDIYSRYMIPIKIRRRRRNYMTFPIRKSKSLIKRCIKCLVKV